MCANTQAPGRKKGQQRATLQLLELVQGLSAPAWRSVCLKVCFFSLHIHGIFLNHMWKQRTSSSHRGAVAGRRSMKYVCHSCYCSVKASESSSSRIPPVKQISTCCLREGFALTASHTGAAYTIQCATLDVDSETVAPVRCFRTCCTSLRSSCFSLS